MLYYYSLESTYKTEINFNAFFYSLNQNKIIYKDIKNIDKYIEDWKKVFFDIYTIEKNKIFKFVNIKNYYVPLKVAGSEMRIHFAIGNALSLARTKFIQQVPLSCFSYFDDGYATINYGNCSLEDNYNSIKNENPIIIIPYEISGFSYLVIDGNHRITKFKNSNQKTVDCVLLSIEETLSLIGSNFEKAIYLFLIESSDIEYFVNNSATQYYHNGAFNLKFNP